MLLVLAMLTGVGLLMAAAVRQERRLEIDLAAAAAATQRDNR